jgi:hypothetical protein
MVATCATISRQIVEGMGSCDRAARIWRGSVSLTETLPRQIVGDVLVG